MTQKTICVEVIIEYTVSQDSVFNDALRASLSNWKDLFSFIEDVFDIINPAMKY